MLFRRPRARKLIYDLNEVASAGIEPQAEQSSKLNELIGHIGLVIATTSRGT